MTNHYALKMEIDINHVDSKGCQVQAYNTNIYEIQKRSRKAVYPTK
jgi:hypothetical protein